MGDSAVRKLFRVSKFCGTSTALGNLRHRKTSSDEDCPDQNERRQQQQQRQGYVGREVSGAFRFRWWGRGCAESFTNYWIKSGMSDGSITRHCPRIITSSVSCQSQTLKITSSIKFITMLGLVGLPFPTVGTKLWKSKVVRLRCWKVSEWGTWSSQFYFNCNKNAP